MVEYLVLDAGVTIVEKKRRNLAIVEPQKCLQATYETKKPLGYGILNLKTSLSIEI